MTIRRVVLHSTPEVHLSRIVRFWKTHIVGSRQSCRRSVSNLVERYSSASFQRVRPANMVSCRLVSFRLESRRCPCSAFHAVSAQTVRRVVLHSTPEVRLSRIVRFRKIHIVGSRLSCRRSVSGSCRPLKHRIFSEGTTR